MEGIAWWQPQQRVREFMRGISGWWRWKARDDRTISRREVRTARMEHRGWSEG